MTKLTRKQITEGLKQTPIENILLGSLNADKVNLTKKQKDFARKVAEGKPKAQAYRESYNSKGKPTTEAVEGSKLASNPKIAQMIESFQLANEAREYLIPAQIRTMAIQNLVSISIDQDEKTSNKLKALELIGKMSEVALFSERKEHIHLHTSADIKEKLLEGLRQAFGNSRQLNDLAKRKAESLLIELSDPMPAIDADAIVSETPTPSQILEPSDPLHPDPQNSTNSGGDTLHSNLLKQSDSDVKQSDSNTLTQDLTLTAVIVTNPNSLEVSVEGGGGIISGQTAQQDIQETPPLNISNKKA
jgi:hypothetical protein